jgi:hypothetical protein
MGVGGQRHAPAALPPGKTSYPLYGRLGGPNGRSGWVRKILPPPGFDPQTVQFVASRYTDCAIPAHWNLYIWKRMFDRNPTVPKLFSKFLAFYGKQGTDLQLHCTNLSK